MASLRLGGFNAFGFEPKTEACVEAVRTNCMRSCLGLKEEADTLPFSSLTLVPVLLHPTPLSLHRFRQLFVQLPEGFGHIVLASGGVCGVAASSGKWVHASM